MQNLLVALIVGASIAYATWTLMPQAWRGALSRRVLRREPPAAGGCGGCGSCDAPPLPPGTRPITVHRRPTGG